jgi:hypothetical protein
MRSIKLIVLCALSLLLSANVALAKQKGGLVDEYSGQGYGMAGCGLGSILFGAKPGKIQIISSTTNGLYGNQTFGITSGTSNCDIPKMGQQAAVFIEVNKEVVRKEAAIGNGDSVDAISMLLNCQKESLSNEIKSNYNHYLGQDVDSYETVRRIMNSGHCTTKG